MSRDLSAQKDRQVKLKKDRVIYKDYRDNVGKTKITSLTYGRQFRKGETRAETDRTTDSE